MYIIAVIYTTLIKVLMSFYFFLKHTWCSRFFISACMLPSIESTQGGEKTFTSFHNAMWTCNNPNKHELLLISDMINLSQESLESERMQYVLPDGSMLEVS